MNRNARSATIPSIESQQSFMDTLVGDVDGFAQLADLLRKQVGINLLPNEKNYTLMASRLQSVLKERDLNSYRQYMKLVSSDASAMTEFISSMTTNTTQFFREAAHFDFFKKSFEAVLREKEKRHDYDLRIWCAASSTGQEVYTILMVLLEQLAGQGAAKWNIKFLATDIDLDVLARAASGVYQESELQGVPAQMRANYFKIVQRDGQKAYRVKADLIDKVRFAQFNLVTKTYPFQHPFDFVFCRNVLIYFDQPTAAAVIENLARSLGPSGMLFLGHSESGLCRSTLVKPVAHGVYQRNGK